MDEGIASGSDVDSLWTRSEHDIYWWFSERQPWNILMPHEVPDLRESREKAATEQYENDICRGDNLARS